MFDDIQKMRPVDVMPDTTGFVPVSADVDAQPKFPENDYAQRQNEVFAAVYGEEIYEGEMPEDD
jgi:hypothetical protein